MLFKKEIEQSLEQIQTLEEQFRQARKSELLPLSFFSLSYDIIRDLANTLHYMEQGQLKIMEEHFIANKVSFLETTGLAEKSNVSNSIIPEEEIKVKPENEIAEFEPAIEPEKISTETKELLDELTPSSEEELLKNSLFNEIKKEDLILADLQKYMSLNDKFRFQRELFNGSAEEMENVMKILNEFETFQDTLLFLENQQWNPEDEIVVEFKTFIEKRFS